ncbi:CLUMA_CG010959, isoform A [Clunio marinus]|uniref:CLUMA_CG010959, isoform A n=1 Tax=Clunio marinus TaxID=568069 RepID=A0A1J1IBB3_9DIPT|nr:CLUMA_CG010959, isoform A [Clunio marinus]
MLREYGKEEVVNRTVLIWYLKDLSNAKDRKTFRVNVDYDHFYKLVWSPDSKAILGIKSTGNAIEAYRLEKKDGAFTTFAKALTFPPSNENDDMISLDIACNGKFIMTATNTTDIVLWDIRGNVLDHLDTCLMTNYCAKISPCGRFIAVSGFTPDVRLWEVKFNKTELRSYDKIVKAFDLTGHKSGVWDFAFDQDSTHLASVCKDGTFKLFHIDIDYLRGESPKCLLNGAYETKAVPPLIALSNSAHVIAIAVGCDVYLFSGITGELDYKIEGIFNNNIVAMKFEATQLFVAGDRQIRAFHNITGYKVAISIAKEKIKERNITTATYERLERQIEDFKAILKEHEYS